MQCGRLNYLNDFYRLASVAMNFYESAHHDYYICEACCIDTFQDFFDRLAHETTYAYIGNKNFFNISCHRQTYQNFQQPL